MKSLMIILAVVLSFGLPSCGSTEEHGSHADSTAAASQAEEYTCPMHPQVRSDKPGVCPICHMDLVKADNASRNEGSMEDGVTLNERDQLLANVSTVTVERRDLETTSRAFGVLEIPEPKKLTVSARFNGRIEKVYVDAVGRSVQKSDPMFDIYSPDLIQAQTEYLQALRATNSQDPMVRTAKERLRLLGLSDDQVASLDGSREVPLVLTYLAPGSGVVIEKRIVEGVYVSEGMPLYDMADLSALWNVAEVYAANAGSVRPGVSVSIVVPGLEGRTFQSTVSFVYPVVNPQSRTVKVRTIVNNPGGVLRPNMFTETLFRTRMHDALSVPVSAVLLTGKRALVYVRSEDDDHFTAREVSLGVRAGDRYVVESGLDEGEIVVREGGYLIDSESQLRTGTGSGHQHDGTPPVPSAGGSEMQHDHGS